MLLCNTEYLVSIFERKRFEYYDSGVSFVFIKLNDKVGIKRTSCSTMFEWALVNQAKLDKVGLAPKLYGGFQYGQYYYIVTEVLEVPTVTKFLEERRNQRIDFKAFKKAGFDMYDIGWHNMGWKDGQLVPIDFGEMPR
jgi:hypothetical protein